VRKSLKFSVPRLFLQATILAFLVGATVHPFEPALAIDATADSLEPDLCAGDETLTYVPSNPAVGEEFVIVATSAKHHRGVTLVGTSSGSYQGEYVGQLGWVWRWRVVPRLKGEHRFHLYVDATTPCGEITVDVARSRLSNDSNGNNSGNGNNSNNNDNTEKIRPPRVTGVTPSISCAGGRVTIKGQNFGRSQDAVGGKVIIANSPVVGYLSWHPTEIVVLVPNGALVSQSQDVYVVNDAFWDKGTIDIGQAPC
jgi:hypothetical protein